MSEVAELTATQETITRHKRLPLDQIRTDGGTQARAALDFHTVREYMEAMEDGDTFPPVTVFYDGEDYWLADGFHRLSAARKTKQEDIEADIKQGTRRDAVLYAAGANAIHGLRRSNADKWRAVERLLVDKEWGQWSDREIARHCQVSPTFVGKIRNKLGDKDRPQYAPPPLEVTVHVDSDDAERTYVTKHGTVATMNTSNIGANGKEEAPKPQQPNYMPIWELEQRVKYWLHIQDAPDLGPTYFLEEAQKKGRAFEALLSHLDKYRRPRRKNDVLQAVNNVLEQLRQSQERRQKSRQAVQARETQPTDDWAPWNPRSLWRCGDCKEEHTSDEPIAAYYSESRGRLICGRCMGVRDGMIAAPAQAEVSEDTSDAGRMAVHYSSESDGWETPQWLFNLLDAEFDFGFDVCATPDNAKCEDFYSPEDDGLAQDWPVTACWMNPPYGREIGKWVAKAFNEATAGVTVVCLLPARTDTRWWWDYVIKGEVRFLKGRLKFGNADNGAPFPSAVVVFHKSVPIQKEKVIWWDVGEGELDDA